MSFSSPADISATSFAKDTRAAFTTVRSVPNVSKSSIDPTPSGAIHLVAI